MYELKSWLSFSHSPLGPQFMYFILFSIMILCQASLVTLCVSWLSSESLLRSTWNASETQKEAL
ncbi:hypothetical protein BDV37DRAFT_246175 [Aspergillus pseudonomiae]|uniref:Uncharacterized protein n=1 Tax=Aspergillus pseudonomiae TaxID=1506151 RepID=A0A5N7DFH8_9EURO|nr:uncharacterized protein BDV37DRAFT_246175 [Aspergillus pseudonomiae]KAE8404955.1 hypothetical protein BDV37DRAFT_246175 [Aspergillus pseudonomiae]